MRIAHFSDLHYAVSTLPEVGTCFTYAVDQAIARQAEVAVITGDTTDHALDAHSPALMALARQIRRLADHCPVLMLQGTFSHEPPGTLDLLSLLGGRYPIHVANRLQQVILNSRREWTASTHSRFDANDWRDTDCALLCSCVPTMNKANLAASVGAEQAGQAMGHYLADLLAGYAPGNLLARQRDIPTIALSHGTVIGCMTEHGVPMAGLDHEFTAGALFQAQANAFMLGHIHLHQAWDHNGQVIAYPGSIGRLHYSEQGNKGFLMWEVTADSASCELVATPARRTLELAFAGPPEMDALHQYVANHPIEGAWVRIRWQCLEEERATIDREAITALFRGAAGIKLEGRVLPITRARAEGMARCHQLEKQIDAWARQVDTPAPPLLACLAQLATHSPADIAMAALSREAVADDVCTSRGHAARNGTVEP
ncbi:MULTISPECIES: metallophosphoesterase family protein [unclassified Janthinobacterium]|uniref:metallophosphoesterase family protein n=1 Tax=unclassified Janthinobacterium TaxID=2610881 RepID=UPI00088D8BF8|nr:MULTISPECIES: metallophosphoesterase family protein [unclassified Janthinobacterium]SDA54203.1 exonuclease SbcD [Janthinobacterium sp. 551a]SFB45618.1 exonuclease SbcD [Janthinobacterium sp. 344]